MLYDNALYKSKYKVVPLLLINPVQGVMIQSIL